MTGSPEFRERAFVLAELNGLGGFLIDRDFVDRRAAEDRERQLSDATSNVNTSARSGSDGQAVNPDLNIGPLVKQDSQPSENITDERPRSHPPDNGHSDAAGAAGRSKQERAAHFETVKLGASLAVTLEAEPSERVPSRGPGERTKLPMGNQTEKSR